MGLITDIYLYIGALNKLFDTGEGFLARGFDSIQRIGSGIQNAFNKFAGGAIEGINRAHEEKKKTLNDAVISEYNGYCVVVLTSSILDFYSRSPVQLIWFPSSTDNRKSLCRH